MAGLDEVVIISACRTPVGKFQGSLSGFERAAAGRGGGARGGEAREDRSEAGGRVHHGERVVRRGSVRTRRGRLRSSADSRRR